VRAGRGHGDAKWFCAAEATTGFAQKDGNWYTVNFADGVKGVTAPLALELWYDFHEVGCHLGNVGAWL
jgi:hypothetical protein